MNNSQLAAAFGNVRFASYWLDTLESIADEPTLTHDTSCDLLIVGGGFCGLWAAILAMQSQPDRQVVLIEARSIANGSSGRPAAILSTSIMHGIDNTERLYPDEVAMLERLGQSNLDAIRETLEQHEIECDAHWGGEMTVSIGDAGLDVIRQSHHLYQRYGHDAVLLDKQQTQEQVNSPLFHGAVWSRERSGTVHPGKLARGLKRLALKLGVRIYENTPHRSNKFQSGQVIVTTPKARIRSAKVLLATNAWAVGHRKIKARVLAVRDRIIVTEPLTHRQMADIGWKNRQGIYDTRAQLNYMRLTEDNRILFGGRLDCMFGNDIDPTVDQSVDPYLRLASAFFKTFPQLEHAIQFSHAWSGPIGLTARMAVHYQRYHKGSMIYAGGYSGFGVTATRFGARVGLAILDGDDISETRMKFATTLPAYIPPEPFRWLGSKITMYALDTLDERGGWRKLWVALIQKIGFPLTL
ncbi:MAG: FAD-binding oxidoreductase [Granulosicoccus sp.]|nr:FAD-binding oxidoreductase [Granulosicoccus sp.]